MNPIKRTTTLLWLLLVALIPAWLPPLHSAPPGGASGWNLIFEDNFNSFDSSKWRKTFAVYPAGGGAAADNGRTVGWSPAVHFADANVSVSDGILRLTAKKESINGSTYTSGVVSTFQKFKFKHGYIEARVRAPFGKGLWSAFWLVREQRWAWPPEIDIVELWETDWPNLGFHTWHYNGPNSNLQNQIVVDKTKAPWNKPLWSTEARWQGHWHTWAAEWKENEIKFYVDGVHTGTASNGTADMNHEMYLIFNLAVGGAWPPDADASTPFPSTFEVDWVRVWQRNGGGGGSDPLAGTHRLQKRGSTRYLEAWNTWNGAGVTINSPWNSDSFRWEVIPAGSGFYFIQNKKSGKYLRAPNGNNGTATQIHDSNGGNQYQWKFVSVGNGFYRIENRAFGTSLQSWFDWNGASVTTSSHSNSQTFHWKLD